MLFSKMSSQYQFDAAVMRKCKGSSGLSVAGLEDGHMLDDLNEMLMKLQDLLLANDYRQYIKQSSELVDNIESAEYSFFQKKYASEYSELPKSQVDPMARMAASISDDKGLLLPIKLASLVQHWTAHPNRFGETRPEFANSLRQIASVLKRLNSHLQLQGVSNQLTAYLQEAAQEQCEQPSIPTLAGR